MSASVNFSINNKLKKASDMEDRNKKYIFKDHSDYWNIRNNFEQHKKKDL